MINKLYRQFSNILWGIGAFSFMKFFESKEDRLRILILIVMAIFIGTIIDFVMTDKLYHTKFLKFMVPMALINTILISVQLIENHFNNLNLSKDSIFIYLCWNIIILSILLFSDIKYKKRIAQTLAFKIKIISEAD